MGRGRVLPETGGSFQEAQAAQIQDYFEYRFPFPVRVGSRQSGLLPFMNKTVGVDRVSVFNFRSDKEHPYNGAFIENNSGVPLEAGPITFFQEGRYAGEAVLNYVSRGEKRLVSYGVDYDIQISAKQQTQPETTTRITINRGVAVIYRESVQNTAYQLKNKSTQAKTVVIEHPRQTDRTLKNATPAETTDHFYRFRVPLSGNQEAQLPVTEVISRQTSVSLGTLTRNQLVLFSGRETPAVIREKLGQIVDAQEEIARLRGELKTTQDKIEAVFHDQERLRENLKALRETREDRDLRVRYLEQLAKQEDEVSTLRENLDGLNKDIASAQARLGELIGSLTWQG